MVGFITDREGAFGWTAPDEALFRFHLPQVSATRVPATESTDPTEGIRRPTTGRLRRVAHVELAPIQLSRRQ